MQLTKLQILFLCINIGNCFVILNQNNATLKNIQYRLNGDLSDYEVVSAKQKTLTANSEILPKDREHNATDKETESNTKQRQLLTKIINPQKRDTEKNENKTENYNDLVEEYYLQVAEDDRTKIDFHTKNTDTKQNVVHHIQRILRLSDLTSNCTDDAVKGFGVTAMKCIMQDFRKKRQPLDVTIERLWGIIKIWFFLYFLVALPVWFTSGWCCCCLFCKVFKPHKTIREAKNYLLTNPPGVYKDKYGETHYLPSEKEIEKYEELKHLLRTI